MRFIGEPTPRREPDAQEPSEETLRSADIFSWQLKVSSRILEISDEKEFNDNVTHQKQKIKEKIDNIREEICILQMLRSFSARGVTFGENSEKTHKEKILKAVSICWLTVRQVCFVVYPCWENMGSREKELKLKSTRMNLLRLSGGKGKRGRPKGKLVQCEKTIDGLKYFITLEGYYRHQFLREERVRAGNNKAFNEQMKKILKPTEELVLEIELMQTYNAKAIKKLPFSAVGSYLYRTSSATIRTLALQLVADRKEIIENQNDLRIDSFVQGTKSLLELGAAEICVSDNLLVAHEEQKFVEDQKARILQAEEENMAEFDRRLKEIEESMIKKMEGSPWRYFIKGKAHRRSGSSWSLKPSG